MAILMFIGNILFEIIYWFETRIRLRKIEKAFGIKFNRTQRKWLLHCPGHSLNPVFTGRKDGMRHE